MEDGFICLERKTSRPPRVNHCHTQNLYQWHINIINNTLHLHSSDAFIQSDLQLHSDYTFSLVRVFPGNRTHHLLRR